MKAVGVVKAAPDQIFDLVMSFGDERAEWDAMFAEARVVEAIDGHTDVVHMCLKRTSLWTRSRDLCLLRYWKREENGTYLVFFKSVSHPKCHRPWGRVRALIYSGGYIISPLQHSDGPLSPACICGAPPPPRKPRSQVEHVLEMDVSGWSSWVGIGLSSHPVFLRDSLLLSVAGLREYFACRGGAPLAYYSLGIQRHLIFPTTSTIGTGAASGFVFQGLASGSATGSGSGAGSGSGTWGLASLVSLGTEDGKSQEESAGEKGGGVGGRAGGGVIVSSDRGSAGLGGAVAAAVAAAAAAAVAAGGKGEVGGDGRRTPRLDRAMSNFLDMEDPDEFYECPTNAPSETSSDGVLQRDLSGVMVDGVDASKLPDDWSALSSVPRELAPDSLSLPLFIDWSKLSGSVHPNHSGKGKNCWSRPDCNVYKLRSRSYLTDGSMAPAGEPLCQLVAVDWLRPDKHPAAHVAAQKKCLVQRVRACYGDQAPYFILINLQVPAGNAVYSMVFYFTAERHVLDLPSMRRFLGSDDSYRNNRLSLLPSVPEGSWLVKQAVGSHNVLMGQVMETAYHSTEEYFEVDVNMASSSVVRGIMGMVFGYITNLVVDMAFYLKGETEDELPERILGAVRCSYLELNSAIPFPFR
ncbi:hypothetical protein CLOM_g14053 [Closterium sp. NIES-68]|nr:hypothetical protein CLOM_g14053 [Closterium sp. NIES-68]